MFFGVYALLASFLVINSLPGLCGVFFYFPFHESYKCLDPLTGKTCAHGCHLFEKAPYFSALSVSSFSPVLLLLPSDINPPRTAKPTLVYQRRQPMPAHVANSTHSSNPGLDPSTTVDSNFPLYFVKVSVLVPINPLIVLSHHVVSPSYQSFLTTSDNIKIPNRIDVALRDPSWKATMDEELAALEKNTTWDLILLLLGKTPVGCK